MSKVEIYYLTETGYSLYVARELKRRIPGVESAKIGFKTFAYERVC